MKSPSNSLLSTDDCNVSLDIDLTHRIYGKTGLHKVYRPMFCIAHLVNKPKFGLSHFVTIHRCTTSTYMYRKQGGGGGSVMINLIWIKTRCKKAMQLHDSFSETNLFCLYMQPNVYVNFRQPKFSHFFIKWSTSSCTYLTITLTHIIL